jgi:hypothetical protein
MSRRGPRDDSGVATYTTLIPLDASDAERGRLMLDVAAFVADAREAGLDPVVGVETTSGGDVFLVTVGDDDPAALLDSAA